MRIIPLNISSDGCCLTIKANYFKMSRANFVGGGGSHSVTAIAVIEDESKNSRSDMEKQAERNGL